MTKTALRVTCETCGKVCSPSAIVIHRRKHDQSGPTYPCPHCSRTFRFAGVAAMHVLSHDGIDERFFSKVHMTSEHWLWTAALDTQGYGAFTIHHTQHQAHKVAYERIVGPVPDGLELDHLCRVRHCVWPEHLEPVTHEENCRRAWEYNRAVCEFCGIETNSGNMVHHMRKRHGVSTNSDENRGSE